MLETIFEKTKFKDVPLIIIASIAIVSFWRGIWHLSDIIIYPNDYLKSSIASIIIGIVILLLIASYRSSLKDNKKQKIIH